MVRWLLWVRSGTAETARDDGGIGDGTNGGCDGADDGV